jgi:hypothetical protein
MKKINWYLLIIFGFIFIANGCEDKYVPLVLEPLDISSQGLIKEYIFKNKYEGEHDIGLYVEKPIFHLDKYETNFKLEITIYKNESIILSKLVSKGKFNFNGWENGKGGIALVVYRSPSELPLKKTLKCIVKIIESDAMFEKKYGKTIFYIRKMSDK